jgi:hypothetical protein
LLIDREKRRGGALFPIGRLKGSRIADFTGIGVDGDARLLSELALSSGLEVLQAIGFAIHLEDVDVVGQPIEQRAG